ncbi:initiation factor 2 [Fistulina hepatica ATCC 64428]|nr:initiation factor 2 [Fistulina hepatica ATCC 64428]
MQQAGLEEEASPNYLLKSDYAALLAEEFGFNPIVSDERSFDIYPAPEPVDRSSLPLRPPIVTIMGHVDHGKTTLLDTLRSTSVAKGEAGGITQHIGAFSVPVKTSSSDSVQSITFLDTPGHAAFSAMRARGASVTDIVVLVVAADDGIMPQTREVLDLVKKEQGKVGLVVAINKVDKPDVDPEDAMKELMMEGVELEQFGGNVPAVCISALTGSGLPELVDTLAVVAEMQDLRAECEGNVQGYVLESNVHKGLGNVTTVLVVRGCLKPGAHLICGTHYAKVRLMQDPNGVGVRAAYPGMAITVSGWKTLPNAGDEVLQGTESDVKKAISNREHQAALTASLEGVEALNEVRRADKERRDLEQNMEEYKIRAMDREAAENEPKELCLIIKADVSGSAEAVAGALQGIGNHLATSKVVSSGVGSVTESDIEKAQVIGGSIVAFSVDVHRSMQLLAERHSVEIISSPIIYRLMDNVRERVIKLLPPIIEVSVLGEATVVQTFDLSGKNARKIAGCRVGNGMIKKDKYVKVLRGQTIIYEGSLDTMRQVKKDVMEVRKGMECGLGFPGFNDVREGDFIQSYEKIEKPGVL